MGFGIRALPLLAVVSTACLAVSAQAFAAADAAGQVDVQSQIREMQRQIKSLQKQLDRLKARQHTATSDTPASQSQGKPASPKPASTASGWDIATTSSKDTGITIGGALRFQYTADSYDHQSNRRKGDMAFDTFRLDLRGKVHGIILDTQWRWYTYMETLQHAWVGYDLNDNSEAQLGLVLIPFGNQPYNSHNFFFSSAYYLGLEDTAAMGGKYLYHGDQWNLQAAFLKNDAATATLGNDNQGYSYVVLGEGGPVTNCHSFTDGAESCSTSAGPEARAVNSGALRIARTFRPDEDLGIEVGGSALYGMLNGSSDYVGHYGAYALHTNINYQRWNLQAEAIHYAYSTDDHAARMTVGAYDYYDAIPARADLFTLNVAYTRPVDWGPVQTLTFYNDNSWMTHKSADLADTFMVVTGMAVAAGPLHTYFDFVTARNQPFIGGSMGSDGDLENRFNINVGYYF